MDINAYWKAALSQQPEEMKVFFHKDAFVNWHNMNILLSMNLSKQTANIQETGMEKLNGLKNSPI